MTDASLSDVRLAKALALVCASSALLAVSGCSLQSAATGTTASYQEVSCVSADHDSQHASTSDPTTSLYLINGGWHTGVAVRTSDLDAPVREVLPEASVFPWLELGWGDRDFYLASGYSYWLAIRAAFFSSGTVLQVVGFFDTPERYFRDNQVIRAEVEASKMAELSAQVSSTLARDESGKLKRVADSLYGSGSFYEANGRFSILHTCNSWASETIAAAGCNIHPGVLRASSLVREMKKLPPRAPERPLEPKRLSDRRHDEE